MGRFIYVSAAFFLATVIFRRTYSYGSNQRAPLNRRCASSAIFSQEPETRFAPSYLRLFRNYPKRTLPTHYAQPLNQYGVAFQLRFPLRSALLVRFVCSFCEHSLLSSSIYSHLLLHQLDYRLMVLKFSIVAMRHNIQETDFVCY